MLQHLAGPGHAARAARGCPVQAPLLTDAPAGPTRAAAFCRWPKPTTPTLRDRVAGLLADAGTAPSAFAAARGVACRPRSAGRQGLLVDLLGDSGSETLGGLARPRNTCSAWRGTRFRSVFRPGPAPRTTARNGQATPGPPGALHQGDKLDLARAEQVTFLHVPLHPHPGNAWRPVSGRSVPGPDNKPRCGNSATATSTPRRPGPAWRPGPCLRVRQRPSGRRVRDSLREAAPGAIRSTIRPMLSVLGQARQHVHRHP